eukprot:1180482-Prorocentrum_minimum.AAC.3
MDAWWELVGTRLALLEDPRVSVPIFEFVNLEHLEHRVDREDDLIATWRHMSEGITIWLDPSGQGSDSPPELDVYRKAAISVQTPCKPKEEFYKNEVTGNIHIMGGTWTTLAYDDSALMAQQALEKFLGIDSP